MYERTRLLSVSALPSVCISTVQPFLIVPIEGRARLSTTHPPPMRSFLIRAHGPAHPLQECSDSCPAPTRPTSFSPLAAHAPPTTVQPWGSESGSSTSQEAQPCM